MHRYSRPVLLCSLLGIAALPASNQVFAAPAPHTARAADPCSTHLEPRLAFSSGPGITIWKLTGNGTMNLATTTSGFARGVPGMKVPANDRVAEFTFSPSGTRHHYAGPVNGFVHGATTHLCLNQKLYVDFDESAQGTSHGMTRVRINGQLTAKRATVTVWVMGHKYKLSGNKA